MATHGMLLLFLGVAIAAFPAEESARHGELSNLQDLCSDCLPQVGTDNVNGMITCIGVVTLNVTDLDSSITKCHQYFDSCLIDDYDLCDPIVEVEIVVPPGTAIGSAKEVGGPRLIDIDASNGTITIGMRNPGGDPLGCGNQHEETYDLMQLPGGNGSTKCTIKLIIRCTTCYDVE